MSNSISFYSLAKMIDQSLLHPTMTDKDIREGCRIAKEYNVAAVCVKPYSLNSLSARKQLETINAKNQNTMSVIQYKLTPKAAHLQIQ